MKNQDKLKELLLIIKGNRSLRKWAEDTGVSTATLSNYINDKVRGSITTQTLRKMLDPKSNPCGNVTLEELYLAGGFEEFKSSSEDIDAFLRKFEDPDSINRTEMQQERSKIEKLMRMLIESEVALSKGKYEIEEDNRYKGRLEYISLKVNNNTRIKKWIIVLDTDKLHIMQMGLSATKLGRLLYIEPEQGLKVSLLTHNKIMYEHFCEEMPKLAYRFDFSLILFDNMNVNASEDLYLSFSDESDMFSMFQDKR